MPVRNSKVSLPALLVAVGIASAVGAQQSQTSGTTTVGVVAYPAKGQSSTRQLKDEAECLKWAEQKTGTTAQPAEQASNQPTTGQSAKKGAAVGGAVGTGIGIITGRPVRGAATGAAAGGATGYAKGKSQQKSAQTASAQAQQNLTNAYAACLDGRGYTTR